MAKFSKDKRDNGEYRSVLDSNSTRTDFICPHCKHLFSLGEANHSEHETIEEAVSSGWGKLPHIEKLPCYSFRFDTACIQRLKKNENIISRLIGTYFLLVIVGGLILFINLKADVLGYLIAAAFNLFLFIFPIIMLEGDEKWDFFAKLHLPTIKSIDFDEALRNNAVVAYEGMMSSSERREKEKLAEKREIEQFTSFLNIPRELPRNFEEDQKVLDRVMASLEALAGNEFLNDKK